MTRNSPCPELPQGEASNAPCFTRADSFAGVDWFFLFDIYCRQARFGPGRGQKWTGTPASSELSGKFPKKARRPGRGPYETFALPFSGRFPIFLPRAMWISPVCPPVFPPVRDPSLGPEAGSEGAQGVHQSGLFGGLAVLVLEDLGGDAGHHGTRRHVADHHGTGGHHGPLAHPAAL